MPKKTATKNQPKTRAKTPANRTEKKSERESAPSVSKRKQSAKVKALRSARKSRPVSEKPKKKSVVRAEKTPKKKTTANAPKPESIATVEALPAAQESMPVVAEKPETKPSARKRETVEEKPKSAASDAELEPSATIEILEDEQEPAIDFAEDAEGAEEAEKIDDKLSGKTEASEDGEAEEEIAIELPKELEPKDEKPSSREEDYALIDVIREGDRYKQEQAFKKLLSKYRGQIYNLILKIVHNPNEVEDLVQESFSKAFNSIANFNKEFAFSTWLYRIATNSSIDFLRKRRLKTFSIDSPIKTKDDEYTVEIPDSSDEPEKNVIQSQRDALVREAIQQLPPKYRAVIEMRHLQELSYEEIASELKIPLGTVKAHIFRAREMLYKMLRDKLRSLLNA